MKELTLTALDQIDVSARDYAEAQATLGRLATTLHDEMEALRRRHLKSIKLAAAEAALRRADLEQLIRAHPEIFVKPRTFTCHGVRVGYQKGKGKIECVNEEAVIERIEKILPEQADVLIRIQKKIARSALQTLDVATLRRLGLVITDTEEEIVIKDERGDVARLVAKLLAESEDDQDEQS